MNKSLTPLITVAIVALVGYFGFSYFNPTVENETMDKSPESMAAMEEVMMDEDVMMLKEDVVMVKEDVMMVKEDAMMKKEGIVMEEKGVEAPQNGEELLAKYQFGAVLEDVANGNSSGQAMAGYSEEGYRMIATFKNLPEPKGTDFYEGWLVQKSPLDVISTGVVEKNQDGVYVDTFVSADDLTSHDFYVLTIEPDDGDPAPADHIVEGTFRSL